MSSIHIYLMSDKTLKYGKDKPDAKHIVQHYEIPVAVHDFIWKEGYSSGETDAQIKQSFKRSCGE